MEDKGLRETILNKVEELKTLRDELKVRAHLGGMDGKELLSKVESELFRLEQQLRETSDSVSNRVQELAQEAKGFFETIKEKLRESI